jgi:hypothetical protein
MRGACLETADLSRRECCNEGKWLSLILAICMAHHVKKKQCRSRLCAVTEVTHLKLETETYERDKKMVRGWAPHDPKCTRRPKNLTAPCTCIINMRTRAKTIKLSKNKARAKPYLAELGLWSLTASERTSADLRHFWVILAHINVHTHAIYAYGGEKRVVWDQNGHSWPI